MKRIEAIIRPHKMDEVLQALADVGASGVTVVDTVGFGRQLGHSEVFQEPHSPVGLVPKRMLILYVADNKAEELVHLIGKVARTGNIGDGKMSVSRLESLTRIRTGEVGDMAL